MRNEGRKTSIYITKKMEEQFDFLVNQSGENKSRVIARLLDKEIITQSLQKTSSQNENNEK